MAQLTHARDLPRSRVHDLLARWRYDGSGARDSRLDALRGYALAAMATNHFGYSQSHLHRFTGRGEFLISAAELFFFISGFTLGVICSRSTGPASWRRLLRRSGTVYIVCIGLSVATAVVALTTHVRVWGALQTRAWDGPVPWLLDVLTLRASTQGADVLVAYVVYLVAAALAVRLLHGGRTGVVIVTIVVLYAASQIVGPAAFDTGLASFRALIPNAPVFFGGLVIGFHRTAINERLQRLPRGWLLDVAALAIAAGLMLMYVTDYRIAPSLEGLITGDAEVFPLLVREWRMPVVPLLVCAVFLRLAWRAVDLLWVPIERWLGWFLLPLGRASLFTFGVHLAAIAVVRNLSLFPGAGVGRVTQTLWVLVYLLLIRGAVKVRDELRVAELWQRLRVGPGAVVAALVVVLLVVGQSPTSGGSDWGDRSTSPEVVDRRDARTPADR